MSIEAFIENAPAGIRKILRELHVYLSEQLELRSQIRYQIPFYGHHGWICYLNPVRGKDSEMELVFIHGQRLMDEKGLLKAKERKQVAGLTLSAHVDLDWVLIEDLIQQALILDEMSAGIKSKF